jgi:hypothetical protein
MVELPNMILPTIERIYQSYEENAGDWRRNHLGASIIGGGCERSLWYTFRWATKPKYDGRLLRLFETGNQQESRIVKNLKGIGIEVYDLDPETGKQIHFEMFGGHYAGSCDAIARGFKESKQWHILEFKTSNAKQFNALSKSGVERTKFEHYCQMQQYMKWADLDRAYYICVCKDTDEIYGERIHIDKELVKRLEMKAERIIFADLPPYKITDNPDDFKCRFCNHKDICHGNKLPEVSCRTCANANSEPNGTWVCVRDNHILCGDEQRTAKKCHIFIPDFVKLEQTDSDPKAGTISYGSVVNGPGAILSTELQEVLNKLQSGEVEI